MGWGIRPRVPTMVASVGLVVTLVGCKKGPLEKPQEPEPDGGFSVVEAAADAGPLSTVAEPAPPRQDPPPADGCSLAAYQYGLREGGKAFAEKRYNDAVVAFERAVKARPLDGRARGELGYAQLHAGSLDDADTNLRIGAQLAGGEPKLAAQIWFNRGLVAEKRGTREVARASFAVSDGLNSSGATRSKLQGQSKCPVAIEPAGPGVAPVEIVTGWKNVHAHLVSRIMGGDDGEAEKAKGAPATDAEARRRACVSYALSEKVDGNPCQGASPWEVQTGHLMYRDFITSVAALDAAEKRFALVDIVRGSGGQASGFTHGFAKIAGNRLLVVTTTGEAHFIASEESCVKDPNDPTITSLGSGYGAINAVTSNDFVVYDTTTGKALVTGITWGDDAADSLKLSATTLEITSRENTKACETMVTKL